MFKLAITLKNSKFIFEDKIFVIYDKYFFFTY